MPLRAASVLALTSLGLLDGLRQEASRAGPVPRARQEVLLLFARRQLWRRHAIISELENALGPDYGILDKPDRIHMEFIPE